jgi:hypothetical protein
MPFDPVTYAAAVNAANEYTAAQISATYPNTFAEVRTASRLGTVTHF